MRSLFEPYINIQCIDLKDLEMSLPFTSRWLCAHKLKYLVRHYLTEFTLYQTVVQYTTYTIATEFHIVLIGTRSRSPHD